MNGEELRTLKMVLVPKWLEPVLKAHAMQVSDVLDRGKLTSILSPSDVDIYDLAQTVFMDIASHGEISSDTGSEFVHRYLYGELADPAQCTRGLPAFDVQRVGYDTLVLTVNDKGQFVFKDFMESLMIHWRASNDIGTLARHPLFARYLALL